MCPLLGTASQFYSSPSGQDAFLLTSMAAIGMHLSQSGSNPHLFECRRLADIAISTAGVRLTPNLDGSSKSFAYSVLSEVQALTIQVFFEFGLADENRAKAALKKAVSLCFETGLHQIDQPHAFASGSGSGTLPLQSMCAVETQDQNTSQRWLAESLRRTWWELFNTDILMFCASSGSMGGNIEKNHPGIHVSFSADPSEELLANPRRDLCSMRIRSGELLVYSAGPTAYLASATLTRFSNPSTPSQQLSFSSRSSLSQLEEIRSRTGTRTTRLFQESILWT